MNEARAVRISIAMCLTVGYVARLFVHGNGPVDVFGLTINSFALYGLLMLTIAIPEWMDQLPVGPSKK